MSWSVGFTPLLGDEVVFGNNVTFSKGMSFLHSMVSLITDVAVEGELSAWQENQADISDILHDMEIVGMEPEEEEFYGPTGTFWISRN